MIQTDVEQFAAAREALLDELQHLDDADAFTDEEFDNALTQLEVAHIYECERPSKHVHTVGYWWAVADLDYYETYLDKLRHVTRSDVQEFARRYVIDQPSVTGTLLSPEMRAVVGDIVGTP